MKQEWKNQICIVDDVIPSGIIDNWTKFILNSIHWSADFNSGTSVLNSEFFEGLKESKIYEQFQFNFNAEAGNDQPYGDKMLNHMIYQPLVNWCMHNNFALPMHNISRCKVNLQTRGKLNGNGKYNLPHVDQFLESNDNWAAIYYMNDSDGDTYFFKDGIEKFTQAMKDKDASTFNNFKIKSRIAPKKGKLIAFPMDQVHAGSHPIESDFRAVINYNFKLQRMENRDEILSEFFKGY